ncbi:alpha/beta fold hydrolase [Streptomyces lunaelactis]|uniref:alpha/beta fold hydrolase n=1 Tax=Streptomyces lunaelactis TaxID=1535768 RepID=UPI001584D0D2|nr:alpha/beta hydrolase [Streptomyces lunaelactis]NUK21588.1 alpha/beta fold hydrolase [Streptomyces lunaelactis]
MPQPHVQYVEAAPGVRLWTERRGDPDASVLLLIMGAQASGLGWPEELCDALAARHQVVRYDHRDTGRSTWSYGKEPYRITDLADDVIAVLDGLGVERAHLVGMSLGGMLAQLVLSDDPDRLLSATLIGTNALSTTPLVHADGTRTAVEDLPGIDQRILEEWARPVEDQGVEAELDRRVRHWRLLHGDRIPFDAEYFRALERRIIEHTGRYDSSGAHGQADYSGMDRTEALAATRVPTLVIAAGAEPVFPPPHPQHLAQVLGEDAALVEIPGMGHALPRQVLNPLAEAVLAHTAKA